MKLLTFLSGILMVLASQKMVAQQNDTAQIILSDAKNVPNQTGVNNASQRTTPALHTLTNSKQTSNTHLPADVVALPAKGTVVPGHKK